MKIALFFFLLFYSFLPAHANFLWAEVGVDGLTCSLCSRSVEMKIRDLDFVEDVSMDLENSKGHITFKEGMEIKMEKISKAVTDAGFSVRYLRAGFDFHNMAIKDNGIFEDGGAIYRFIKTGDRLLEGDTVLTFIGSKFQPDKEFKKWKSRYPALHSNLLVKEYFVTIADE